ncbi:LOW QUALITY PROTEIN: adhesion G protein-coupled receptor A1 [Talpa occidentalis]|uniref:LOW QUALITY PROTEIN: adhesion G protein-coupled receptor A1 n=1 Tax=Talpa occidentalis TaxID=50954 RepID=UPI0018901C84|nr:LOW QUALITY PROTEIN: adhesion G protein-coupled receptor A1 [Talpa occidentalis]
MDLKTELARPQHPGELLHPVVYACTAVMLLCLLASAVTYLVHRSAIRISRKGRHALLNLCLHAALTFTVFAGGVNRTKYPTLCQAVGVALHYCTLCTLLWIAVAARNVYQQVARKAPPAPGAGQPPAPRQPLLRFYLVSGGVPFIICGVTAATNIRNYGREDENSGYCWMAWEPSLGAFYGPAAFIALVTCLYLLGTYVQLRRHPERRYELGERPEQPPRLAGRGDGALPRSPPSCEAAGASLLQNEHSFKAQLRAAAFTLFLFTATWAFGALAVSQGHFLDMVFSCLYGAFCVTLGLFVLIHHCAKREDVWHCWWSCCPARGDAPARRSAHPLLDANGEALGHPACLQDSPCPGPPRGFGHSPAGHCKMAELRASQSRVSCLAPTAPCCPGRRCEQLLEEDAFAPDLHLHRCPQARTKLHYFGRPLAEPECAYHIPASLDGSPLSSRSDSARSSLEGPAGVPPLACCTQGDPFPGAVPEGGSPSPRHYGCVPAHFEMLRRTQSLPFGAPGQSGLPESLAFGADSAGNIRTGLWRNETTV